MKNNKGPIAWMAGNSVVANLLMAVLLFGGLFMGFNIKQEVFPEYSLDWVNIYVGYPGASPEEVETGIILAVEEAVQGLEGVDEINAKANEGSAIISVKALDGTNINRLWQEIKSEVDRISSFPDESEDPKIVIATRKREVLRVALYGKTSQLSLRTLADQIQDELLQDENITQVDLKDAKDKEIHIEIPNKNLSRYKLTLQDIALAISKSSVELGAGSIKTKAGEILLRIKDKKDYAQEYARLPIITKQDGSNVLLEDIADITEGFEDTDNWTSFNGKPCIIIEVYRTGKQTPIAVSKAGKKIIKRINKQLPETIELSILRDSSKIFAQRANLLIKNAYIGLGLVFLFLSLFLEIRLAFWVSLGIPISFLGSFLFLSPTSFSINIVSMFAFIVTLGIVVDDAVVIGENIYFYKKQGLNRLEASIKGTKDMALPIVFSIITNITAFIPLLFVPGIMGKVFKIIPIVVIAVFSVSLIESLFILPAHLSHQKEKSLFFPLNYIEKWQKKFSTYFESFVKNHYGNFLLKILHYRYSVISFGISLLMITAGYVASGRMGMVMFPKIESNYAFCEAYLPYGSSEESLKNTEFFLVETAKSIVKNNGDKKLSTGIFSQVKDNRIRVRIYLTDPDIRPLSTSEVTNKWRKKTSYIPGVENITFESDRGGPGSGKNLSISLEHREKNILDKAAHDLAQRLFEYSNVHDIDDGSAKGKKQFDLSLTSAGKRMGLNAKETANQIRHAFYGISAVKNQRQRNEVTIKVRLPKKERQKQAILDELILRTPKGEISFYNAVKTIIKRAYTSISRINGKREILITANVKPASQAANIMAEVKKEILPKLINKYPGLNYDFKGHQAEIRQSIIALLKGLLLALFCIFALLAIPFKSYFQPFIIMFCIPFGIIGAIAGHIIMGYSLSVMSLFGLVAMTGVVVNDSLVLIYFANIKQKEGETLLKAIHLAGIKRFRPILLTTLTTCAGLAPIITETSRQARFLIPMAISLGFGILFATFITLVMVPCLYIILEDIMNFFNPKNTSICKR